MKRFINYSAHIFFLCMCSAQTMATDVPMKQDVENFTKKFGKMNLNARPTAEKSKAKKSKAEKSKEVACLLRPPATKQQVENFRKYVEETAVENRKNHFSCLMIWCLKPWLNNKSRKFKNYKEDDKKIYKNFRSCFDFANEVSDSDTGSVIECGLSKKDSYEKDHYTTNGCLKNILIDHDYVPSIMELKTICSFLMEEDVVNELKLKFKSIFADVFHLYKNPDNERSFLPHVTEDIFTSKEKSAKNNLKKNVEFSREIEKLNKHNPLKVDYVTHNKWLENKSASDRSKIEKFLENLNTELGIFKDNFHKTIDEKISAKDTENVIEEVKKIPTFQMYGLPNGTIYRGVNVSDKKGFLESNHGILNLYHCISDDILKRFFTDNKGEVLKFDQSKLNCFIAFFSQYIMTKMKDDFLNLNTGYCVQQKNYNKREEKADRKKYEKIDCKTYGKILNDLGIFKEGIFKEGIGTSYTKFVLTKFFNFYEEAKKIPGYMGVLKSNNVFFSTPTPLFYKYTEYGLDAFEENKKREEDDENKRIPFEQFFNLNKKENKRKEEYQNFRYPEYIQLTKKAEYDDETKKAEYDDDSDFGEGQESAVLSNIPVDVVGNTPNKDTDME